MIRIFSQYVSPKSVLLVALETLLIGFAVVGGVFLRFLNNSSEAVFYLQAPEFAAQIAAFILVFQACFYWCNVYDPKFQRHRAERWLSLWQALGTASISLGLIYFLVPELLIGRGVFFISVALVPIFVVTDRLVLERVWKAAGVHQNLLIIGTQGLARAVARELAKHENLNVNVAGFLATHADSLDADGLQVLGRSDDVEAIAARYGVTRIVVALEDRRGNLPVRQLVTLRVQGIRVEEAHSMLSSLTGRVWLQTVQPSWFVFTGGFRRSAFTSFIKRTLDLTCGILGFIVSLPIMLVVAAAIRIDSKGPILYRQCRVGLRGRNFDVLKFRSMRTDAEKLNGAQWAQENDPRVTRVGRILRKYRLDELPQFFNVIRGEMSFVGPRPERPVFVEQLRQHISYYDERHSVRPGLTGWAQVQYRYGASAEDAFRKLEYDLFYLKNMSLLFDLAIIFKTIRIVFGGDGAR